MLLAPCFGLAGHRGTRRSSFLTGGHRTWLCCCRLEDADKTSRQDLIRRRVAEALELVGPLVEVGLSTFVLCCPADLLLELRVSSFELAVAVF
jgi:hypothetical protein